MSKNDKLPENNVADTDASETEAPEIETSSEAESEEGLLKRVGNIEALFELWVEEWGKRDNRMERADLAMRSYFTDELGRLREAITDELYVRATQRLLMDILPILNGLDNLLIRPEFTCPEVTTQNEQTTHLWNTLGAYRRSFYNCLRRLGLEEISIVEGETMFNPDIHECVEPGEGEELPDTETLLDGAILKVRRRGYHFRGELFQAPQVIIKGGEDDVSQSNWD